MTHVELHTSSSEHIDGIREFNMKSGNKHLLLSINIHSKFAETELTTISEDKTVGATTDLYKRAKEILIEESQHIGPITYRMSTGFRSMKKWMNSIGNSIFHWEKTYYSIDDPEKLVAETTIHPPED